MTESDNGQLRYFRNWTYVKAEDIEHIKVFKRKEEGEMFYVSSTNEYIPFWLKKESQSNIELCHSDEEVCETSSAKLSNSCGHQAHAIPSCSHTISRNGSFGNEEKRVFNFQISIKSEQQANAIIIHSEEVSNSHSKSIRSKMIGNSCESGHGHRQVNNSASTSSIKSPEQLDPKTHPHKHVFDESHQQTHEYLELNEQRLEASTQLHNILNVENVDFTNEPQQPIDEMQLDTNVLLSNGNSVLPRKLQLPDDNHADDEKVNESVSNNVNDKNLTAPIKSYQQLDSNKQPNEHFKNANQNTQPEVNNKDLNLLSSLQRLNLSSTQSQGVNKSLETYWECKYKKDIADCKIIKNFVDEILERDNYLNKKKVEKEQLTNLLEEAAIKTEIEKENLDNKEISSKRICELMKRLSMNSKAISNEAYLAREEYNKSAKVYNDTIKNPKVIKISENVQKAFTNILVFKDITNNHVNAEPYYITAKELYTSQQHKLFIEKIPKD